MTKRVCMVVLNNCKNDARVLKEAGSLADHGYSVTIIALFDRNCTEHDLNEQRGKFNIIRIKPQFLVSKVLQRQSNSKRQEYKHNDQQNYATSPIRYLKKLVRKMMVPMYKITVFTDFHIKAYMEAMRISPDIIHCHDLNTLSIGYFVKKNRKQTKLIYDSHELFIYRNKKKNSKLIFIFEFMLERFLIKRAEHVITVCGSISEFLAEKYEIRPPTVVMNCPEAADTVKPRGIKVAKSGYEVLDRKDIRKVLYLGSRTFNRGIENLIESMKYVQPNVHLVLMGPHNEEHEKEFKRIAELNALRSRVHFLDPVAHNEVLSYSQKVDVGVSPIMNACLSYYYCLPNKLFEYINSNIPVLSSDFPEMKRIVEANQVGMTFDPTDVKDIAEKINAILEPRNYAEFKVNCEKIQDVYTWAKEEGKLLKQVYGKL